MTPRRGLLVALALTLLTAVTFAGVLQSSFLNYDDDLYVTQRPEVRAGLSGDGVVWAFTSFQGANWFPLTRLSWMLDAQLFGVRGDAFHASSLAWHLLGTWLLFWALVRLTGAPGPSAFAAAVFAIHPLHVEPVAWVAARKDVLSGVFFALALLAHERVARSRRPVVWSLALFAAMALGLMAKPMLVTLPFVLLLLDVWPLGRLSGPDRRTRARRLGLAVAEKLPLFALAVGASWVTLEAQRAGGALRDLGDFPLLVRLEAAVDAPLRYLTKTVWPVDLAVFYPHPLGRLPWWHAPLVGVGLLWLSGAALRQGERRPWLPVGWFWFLGMLVPVSGLVQVGQAAMADRYTYLPLVGLAVAVAWSGRELASRGPRGSRAVCAAALAAVLALAVVSARQVRSWRDSRTLFEHALRVTAGNHVAHINLAAVLASVEQYEAAEEHLDAAVALVPGSATAWGMRGEVRLLQGRPGEARSDFGAALRHQPDSSRWQLGLARALADLGGTREASRTVGALLSREPDHAAALALLAALQAREGRRDEAIASYRRALARESELLRDLGAAGVAQLHAQLAAALAPTPERALAHLEAAVALVPTDAAHHADRAAVLELLGRPAEAAAAYAEALRLGARTPRVLNNLAWLRATSEAPGVREPGTAVALAEEAAEVTGREDAGVLDTLATAYAAAGRPNEARATARRALLLAEAGGRQRLAASLRERFDL